jgi:hypothetical protein
LSALEALRVVVCRQSWNIKQNWWRQYVSLYGCQLWRQKWRVVLVTGALVLVLACALLISWIPHPSPTPSSKVFFYFFCHADFKGMQPMAYIGLWSWFFLMWMNFIWLWMIKRGRIHIEPCPNPCFR